MKSGYKQTQVGVIPEEWKIWGPGTGNFTGGRGQAISCHREGKVGVFLTLA
jgi:hypothetical protein